jgi:hypothetical protein
MTAKLLGTVFVTQLALLMLVIVAATSEAATVRIYGSVTDTTGAAVPGATVIFRSAGDTVSVLSDGNGLYELTVSDTPSGVEEGIAPSTYELSQNYPNPFNPSTTIQFSLNSPSPVSLDVYSVTGQHVRALVSGMYETGVHSVVWNGRDDSGRGVSAGVYLYRLCAGEHEKVKKMLLLDGSFDGKAVARKNATRVQKRATVNNPREYSVVVTKSTMRQYLGTISVTFDHAEQARDIVLPDHYIPFMLFLDSVRIMNEFIMPGDTLGVTLVNIHEPLPANGTVMMQSQAGDRETVTISGGGVYYRKFGYCAPWTIIPDCRKGTITSIIAPSVQGDGMIQVSALSDTINVWFVSLWGDSITTNIPVVDSVQSVVLWGMTYVTWNNREWYILVPGGSWEKTESNSFCVNFTDSTTENEISQFIQDNHLQLIFYDEIFNTYYLKITNTIHAVEFLKTIENNIIIKNADVDTVFCVIY